jgi:SAM-dependent methyltransferase
MSGPSPTVLWHDLECGAYDADLPLWRELAAAAGGSVLEVGAGTGRVALDLAGRGHEVTALERDGELLAELRRRAAALPVHAVQADARRFALEREFALCLVPMQTIQLLGGPAGRAAFLRRARDHLGPGALLAAAIAGSLEGFSPHGGEGLPLPDVREQDGWVYCSQPVGMHVRDGATVIERLRQTVAPDGTRTEAADQVRLDRLDPALLAAEAAPLGYGALAPRRIEPTAEHVASDVALLRAPGPRQRAR